MLPDAVYNKRDRQLELKNNDEQNGSAITAGAS